jgi:Flp pilus assembly protein TadD
VLGLFQARWEVMTVIRQSGRAAAILVKWSAATTALAQRSGWKNSVTKRMWRGKVKKSKSQKAKTSKQTLAISQCHKGGWRVEPALRAAGIVSAATIGVFEDAGGFSAFFGVEGLSGGGIRYSYQERNVVYRRPTILGIACVMCVCAVAADRAEGQFFVSRSRSAAWPNRAITSPLLDRMFSRGSCLSHGYRPPCNMFISRSIGTTYCSDGTPFDPFAVGSFPDRFQNSGSLYGTTAVSAALRGGAYVSSNAVDMQAPASYGLTTPMEVWPSDLAPRPIGGWSAGAEPVMASSSYAPAVAMPPPSGEFAQAMWSARQAKLGEPIEAPQPSGPAAVAMQIGDRSFRRGEYALARDDYRRALARDKGDPDVRLALGLAEIASGRWPQASKAIVEGLKKGGDLNPESFDLRKAYGRPGDFEKHRARLEAAAAKSPDDAGLCLLLGYVRYFSGDVAGGRAAWEKYAALPSPDPTIKSYIESLSR